MGVMEEAAKRFQVLIPACHPTLEYWNTPVHCELSKGNSEVFGSLATSLPVDPRSSAGVRQRIRGGETCALAAFRQGRVCRGAVGAYAAGTRRRQTDPPGIPGTLPFSPPLVEIVIKWPVCLVMRYGGIRWRSLGPQRPKHISICARRGKGITLVSINRNLRHLRRCAEVFACASRLHPRSVPPSRTGGAGDGCHDQDAGEVP